MGNDMEKAQLCSTLGRSIEARGDWTSSMARSVWFPSSLSSVKCYPSIKLCLLCGHSYSRFPVQGKVLYANGDVYVGNFEDGARIGTGELTKNTGELLHLVWKDQITCHIKYSNGDIYDGDFAMDGEKSGRHGRGVQRFINGDVYEGEWALDLRHGDGVLTVAPANHPPMMSSEDKVCTFRRFCPHPS